MRTSRKRHAEPGSDHDPRVAELEALIERYKDGIQPGEQGALEKRATAARRTVRGERGNVPLRRAAGRLYRLVRSQRTTEGKKKPALDGQAVGRVAGALEARELDTLTPGDVFARNPDGTRGGRLVSVSFGWAEVTLYGKRKLPNGEAIMVGRNVTIARRSPVFVPVGTPVCTTNVAGPPPPSWIAELRNVEPAKPPRSRVRV